MRSRVSPGSVVATCLLAIASAIALSGCGSTKVLQPSAAVSSEEALVYFIRKRYPPYIHAVRLSVNGTLLATLSNSDYVAVRVPIGTNKVAVDVIDGKPLAFDLPVKNGDTMYVVLTGEVSKSGQAATGYNQFTVYLDWNLWAYPVSRSEAEGIVAELGES